MNPRVRVLVVEDSLTVRRRIASALAADSELEVIGEAADGPRAIELCAALRPDVITLDLVLPGLDGVAVTEQVMAFHPTPIVVVSGASNRGEVLHTYDALAAGALDAIEKPDGTGDDATWDNHLRRTVKTAARVKVITHPRARLGAATHRTAGIARPIRAIAIGASTGGPAALARVLHALPADLPVPILLVIHVASAFAAGAAEWLDGQSKIPVRSAVHGEPLPRRGVIVPAPDRHLIVERDGTLRLDAGPPRHFCRPAVDPLFESVAQAMGADSVGCLLTGMGRDGAAGLLAMRRAGATTIAQDEATSVVWGMPREAVVLGAAERVLPLDSVATTLRELAAQKWGQP